MATRTAFRTRGFALACASSALFSLLLIWLGFYLLPRPPYPTYDEAVKMCANCTSRVAVSLQFQEMVLQYGRTTFMARSLAQFGVGALAAVSLAFVLLAIGASDARTSNQTARSWGEATLAGGVLVFLILGAADIFYANTGDRSSVAFLLITWAEGGLGNQGFGILGTLVLAVAAVGATVAVGLRNAVLRVVAPAALAFSVGLLLFDWKEISIHATDFLATLTVNHTDVLSNWTLLAASGVLTLAGAVGAPRPLMSWVHRGRGPARPAE
ncbi:MAG TPA: hypothetical protein VKF15_04995 [Nitrososphaerales archaeon]|nr:hypothetical protein [Nitrososphaerales archaeon]